MRISNENGTSVAVLSMNGTRNTADFRDVYHLFSLGSSLELQAAASLTYTTTSFCCLAVPVFDVSRRLEVTMS